THLNGRLEEDITDPQIRFLRTHTWLPARGKSDRWYKPYELYAGFNSYLFESQATFVDLPSSTQQSAAAFLRELGVEGSPSAQQVVKHLLWCATNQKEVNREVYRWLNDRSEDPAINHLKGKACLLLSNSRYVRASD